MGSPLDLHGAISAEEKTFIESWENVGTGTHYIIQENRRGDEVQTGITGRRTFRLSTYERMLTEERCLDPRNNPFRNGSFRPITVPTGVSIETNPNAMSDEDINRLFTASDVAWDEYMAVIDSPATLGRMLELAENSNLSLKRYRELERRQERFSQVGKRVTHKDPDIQRQIDSIGSGEPTGGGNPPRSRNTAIRATSHTQAAS